MSKFDIHKPWKPKKRRILTRFLNDLLFMVVVLGTTAVLAVAAVDAYEFEKYGSCDSCVMLGDFYEWRGQ